MTAEKLIKAGRLDEALNTIQNVVKKDPANPRLRIFLFQLLGLMGEWPRAGTQLRLLSEMDSDSEVLARIFEPVLRCESFRADVFARELTPGSLGQSPEWLGLLVKALEHFGKGNFKAGEESRHKAFETAPVSEGWINGESFEWITDADERLGPVLEVILQGRYYWIPFCRIRLVIVEPATNLRDLIWAPAHFVWANGQQASGYIFSRYPGTEHLTDGNLKLARKTEWREQNGIHLGLGQRVLATDRTEYPLLEIRKIQFAPSGNQK
jgi:type VI secretion system protein ImpE